MPGQRNGKYPGKTKQLRNSPPGRGTQGVGLELLHGVYSVIGSGLGFSLEHPNIKVNKVNKSVKALNGIFIFSPVR